MVFVGRSASSPFPLSRDPPYVTVRDSLRRDSSTLRRPRPRVRARRRTATRATGGDDREGEGFARDVARARTRRCARARARTPDSSTGAAAGRGASGRRARGVTTTSGETRAVVMGPVVSLWTRARTFASEVAGGRARSEEKGEGEDEANAVEPTPGAMRVRWTIDEAQGRGRDAVVTMYGWDGKVRGETTLPGRIFDQPLRVDVAHRVVRWQRAKARGGLHKTKTRGEVSGTTRKARPQKGQGRARVGNLKAPQMRGGGVAHGPVVRSHAHKLPKKVRRMGLKVALSAKAAEGKLIVVDSFAGMEPKTRALNETLARLTGDFGLAAGGKFHSALIVDGEFETMSEEDVESEDTIGPSELVRMSARNLPHVEVLPQIGANVYSILRRRALVITKSGLEQLIARLDAPIKR